MFTPTHSDIIDHRQRRWFGRRHLTARCPRRHLTDLAGPMLVLAIIVVLVLATPEADTNQAATADEVTGVACSGQSMPDTGQADTTHQPGVRP